MDKLTHYRQIIKNLIAQCAQVRPAYGDIEVESIYDADHDHYELVYTGWDGQRRVHGSVLHIDIRGEKVWIQHDGIEGGVAEDLVTAGVPREDIVLGFQPPRVRPYTDYAVA